MTKARNPYTCVSCNGCRMRKAKCSGGQPCEICKRRGESCVYEGKRGKSYEECVSSSSTAAKSSCDEFFQAPMSGCSVTASTLSSIAIAVASATSMLGLNSDPQTSSTHSPSSSSSSSPSFSSHTSSSASTQPQYGSTAAAAEGEESGRSLVEEEEEIHASSNFRATSTTMPTNSVAADVSMGNADAATTTTTTATVAASRHSEDNVIPISCKHAIFSGLCPPEHFAVSVVSNAMLTECFKTYYEVIHPMFPIIYPEELFTDRYIHATRESDPAAFAVYNGVLLVGAYISNFKSLAVAAETVRESVRAVFDCPTADYARALLLLGLFELFSGGFSKARVYVKMSLVGSDMIPWYLKTTASFIQHFALMCSVGNGQGVCDETDFPIVYIPGEHIERLGPRPCYPPVQWAKMMGEMIPVGRFLLLSTSKLVFNDERPNVFAPGFIHERVAESSIAEADKLIESMEPPRPIFRLAPEQAEILLAKIRRADEYRIAGDVGGRYRCLFQSAIAKVRALILLSAGRNQEAAIAASFLVDLPEEQVDIISKFPFFFSTLAVLQQVAKIAGAKLLDQKLRALDAKYCSRKLPLTNTMIEVSKRIFFLKMTIPICLRYAVEDASALLFNDYPIAAISSAVGKREKGRQKEMITSSNTSNDAAMVMDGDEETAAAASTAPSPNQEVSVPVGGVEFGFPAAALEAAQAAATAAAEASGDGTVVTFKLDSILQEDYAQGERNGELYAYGRFAKRCREEYINDQDPLHQQQDFFDDGDDRDHKVYRMLDEALQSDAQLAEIWSFVQSDLVVDDAATDPLLLSLD